MFLSGGVRPPVAEMTAFMDQYRPAYGDGAICKVLQIAPLPHAAHAVRKRDPERWSIRVERDVALMAEVRRVLTENSQVCGVRQVWRQMQREGAPWHAARWRG